jgi:hypothetical protein
VSFAAAGNRQDVSSVVDPVRKDPHHFGNLDPHPHQIKIRIRIRIQIFKLEPDHDPHQF